MGALGLKTFDNDDASDWLYDLEESNDLAVIEQALKFDDEYVEAPECCNALAAAEIILALMGKARTGLPENALSWIDKHSHLNPKYLVPKAIEAVSLVVSEDSELVELWEETEDFDNWKKDVSEIAMALQNS